MKKNTIILIAAAIATTIFGYWWWKKSKEKPIGEERVDGDYSGDGGGSSSSGGGGSLNGGDGSGSSSGNSTRNIERQMIALIKKEADAGNYQRIISIYSQFPTKLKTKTLKRGSYGREVAVLQAFLNMKKGKSIAIDGVFGRGTEIALKDALRVTSTSLLLTL